MTSVKNGFIDHRSLSSICVMNCDYSKSHAILFQTVYHTRNFSVRFQSRSKLSSKTKTKKKKEKKERRRQRALSKHSSIVSYDTDLATNLCGKLPLKSSSQIVARLQIPMKLKSTDDRNLHARDEGAANKTGGRTSRSAEAALCDCRLRDNELL